MENQLAEAQIKPLSLVDMSCAFVVFGLGLSLSCLVLFIEFIYKHIKDQYFVNEQVKAPPVRPFDTKPNPITVNSIKEEINVIPTKKTRASRTNRRAVIPTNATLVRNIKQDDNNAIPRPKVINAEIHQSNAVAAGNENRKQVISSFDEILEV